MQKVLAKSKHSAHAAVQAGHDRCLKDEDDKDQAYPPGWRSVCLPTLSVNDIVLRPTTEVPMYLLHRGNGPEATGIFCVRDASDNSVDGNPEVVTGAHNCPDIALSA